MHVQSKNDDFEGETFLMAQQNPEKMTQTEKSNQERKEENCCANSQEIISNQLG